jgi:hypothetical protein
MGSRASRPLGFWCLDGLAINSVENQYSVTSWPHGGQSAGVEMYLR